MTEATRSRSTSQRRGGRGRFEATPNSIERDAEAARLRTRGRNYAEIAHTLGYADASGAFRAVKRAIEATITEPSEQVRTYELERLDFMWAAALAVLEAQHFTVNAKGLVYLGDQPLADDAPVLAAIDRMLKIQDRRAKLLGLDAPAKHEVRTVDDFDDHIRQLMDQLANTGQAGVVTADAGPPPGHPG